MDPLEKLNKRVFLSMQPRMVVSGVAWCSTGTVSKANILEFLSGQTAFGFVFPHVLVKCWERMADPHFTSLRAELDCYEIVWSYL